jgi:hypothetical protein
MRSDNKNTSVYDPVLVYNVRSPTGQNHFEKVSMIIIFHGVREGRVRCQMILTHRCYIKQVYMPI